jgi:hypothetical protein
VDPHDNKPASLGGGINSSVIMITHNFSSAAALPATCEKHRFSWRPHFVRANAGQGREQQSQTAPWVEAQGASQKMQSLCQEPAGHQSGARLPFCQKGFYVTQRSNRGSGKWSRASRNADRASADAKRD